MSELRRVIPFKPPGLSRVTVQFQTGNQISASGVTSIKFHDDEDILTLFQSDDEYIMIPVYRNIQYVEVVSND